MLSENPQEELDKLQKLEDNRSVLNERMEDDYEQFRGQPFAMPKEEGSWDSFTSNSAQVLSNFIINKLSSAPRRFWIPLTTEKKKERKDVALVEQGVIGIVNLADDYLTRLPEEVDSQSALVWDATNRGISAWRFFMHEEDGEVIPDLAIWDPLHVYWISDFSKRSMSWVSYHWYIDLKEARDLAGDDSIGSEEADERVRVTNVLDREQEGLIIGHEYIKREKHKLDYIPVSIIPVGSTRMIRSDRHADDTIHEFGESFANLNRNIFAAEHRLWTYFMTGAGSTAKAPVFIEYDSSLQQLTPDDIKVSPAQKGHINLLDKAKGQAYRGQLEAPSFAHVQFMLQGIQGKLSMGGIPPIAMGSIDSALPVGTTSMLTHAAQSRLWPVKKNVEQQYKRLAAEILRQYVKGKFGKVTVWGKDKSNKDYQIEFSREGLDPKRRVECELVPSLPQEEQVNMGMAAQAVQSGLLSPQSARDRWHLADDPDAEQDKINRFMAENDARVRDWTLAKQLWEDGQKFEAMVILNSLAEKARAGQQAFGIPDEAMMGGGGGRPVQGIPRMTPPSPTGTVARAQTLQVPPEVQEAIRLKQMGLVKGR